MTFGEMLVNTHPNANNSLFANLREASFTNSPTTLDRFTFSAISLTQTKEKTYYGVIYL